MAAAKVEGREHHAAPFVSELSLHPEGFAVGSSSKCSCGDKEVCQSDPSLLAAKPNPGSNSLQRCLTNFKL